MLEVNPPMDAGSDESRLDDMMDRWESQFARGSDLDATELCPDDPRLAEILRQRIAALRAMRPLVDAGPHADDGREGDVATGEERPPVRSVMTYEGLRFHDRGGLGEVYLARNEALGREVAVKFIQKHRAIDSVSRRRFSWEAKVTARLEHPGVIPVHGIGQDDRGDHCYLMPFVRGQTLKAALDTFHGTVGDHLDLNRHGKEFRGLLGRFRSVCATVAYAHSRGILHRDLKPSNVMLGSYDETFVVDWGLAKAMMPPESDGKGPGWDIRPEDDEENPTKEGSGTPGFMSPEQQAADWERVGPASDVYSLGATLFVLLTGRRPFQGANVGEVMQKVARGDHPRPRDVKKGVPLALEAICLKAMALRPEDRYVSVPQMAADIENWLADEPVAAHREPWTARSARWARKHRTAVGTGSAVLITALIGLTAVLVVQEIARRRVASALEEETLARGSAQKRFDLAMEAVGQFHNEVTEDFLLQQPVFEDLRRTLTRAPLDFYRRLTIDLQSGSPDDPNDLPALARAYFEMGGLHQRIGSFVEADDAFVQALRINKQLAEEWPEVPDFVGNQAACLDRLGLLYRDLGRVEDAERAFQEAIQLGRKLAATFPSNPKFSQGLADSLTNSGVLLSKTGRQNAAEAAHREALKIQASLPSEPEVAGKKASIHQNLGISLLEQGRLDEAEEALAAGIAIDKKLAESRPEDERYSHGLAKAYAEQGVFYQRAARFDRAERAYREAQDLLRKLSEASPANLEFDLDLGAISLNLALLLSGMDRVPEAEKSYGEAIAAYRRIVARFPYVLAAKANLCAASTSLGILLANTGRPGEAMEAYNVAESISGEIHSKEPPILLIQRNIYWNRATLLEELERYGDAAEDWTRTIEFDAGQDRSLLLSWRGLALARAGKGEAARGDVKTLLDAPILDAGVAYNAARILSLSNDIGAPDTSLSNAQHSEAESLDLEQIISLLRYAANAGFFDEPANRQLLRTDEDLKQLWTLAPYQALLRDVRFPDDPFATND